MILIPPSHSLTYHPPEPTSPLYRAHQRILQLLELEYPLPVPNLELHSAAASGNVGLVHYALTHGQPVNSVLHGVLPLHAACSGGSVSVVRMLIERGADVNAPRLPRRYSDGKKGTAPSVGTAGSTPLHFAAANGHAPVVQMLLASGADPTKPDKNGNTPEKLAELNGHEDVVHVLDVYRHLQHQDALNDAAESDRAEPPSPSASTSQLADDDDESVKYGSIGSRKGKERAISMSSAKSDTAIKMKKSLEGLLRRGTKHSFTSSQGDESPNSINAAPPPRLSVVSDMTTSDSDHLPSPIELDRSTSPSPQKGNNVPLVGSEITPAGSPSSLTRALSGQSSSSIALGSPPNSITLSAPPPRSRLNSTSSHRPSLPSIIERAVHPGATFRAAMRHHNDKDQKAQSSSEPNSPPRSDSSPPHSGGSFFRGRHKSHEHEAHHGSKKHHKHGFIGLFRRGHSPPSRSPSPPRRTEPTKPIASEDLDQGIERLKRASLDMDRKERNESEVISLNDDDGSLLSVPASAPVTKTKFFPDVDGAQLSAPSEIRDSLTPPIQTPPDRLTRPRKGSEVIVPSPLANEWANDEDSDSTGPAQGIRRVRTEVMRSPSAASPLGSGPASPTSPMSPNTKPRSATLPSGGVNPVIQRTPSGSRIVGLGWEDEADLRKVAASGLIRRKSERERQQAGDEENAQAEAEMEDAEAEEYFDALTQGQEEDAAATTTTPMEMAEEDLDPTPTTRSPEHVDDAHTTPAVMGRSRGASVNSFTTDSSRLSTPPASSFRMSTITNDSESSRSYSHRSTKGGNAPLSVMSVIDSRPRGKSVSSTSSGASGRHSYMQTNSTPATSLTPPSALSLSLSGPGFPPVPEHEVVASHPVARRTLTSRTISSRAEAKKELEENESNILQLAQMPQSQDSSRSLAAQLAAYGESHAIEQEFAELERRGVRLGSSEDGESYFSADSLLSGGSSRSSELPRDGSGRGPGRSGRAVSSPLVPLVSVDAPRSSVPSINTIYDKRAAAYRDRLTALTNIPPVLPPSATNSARRHRQRAVSSHEMWLDAGPRNMRHSSYSSQPGSEMGDELGDDIDRYPQISGPMPVIANPVTGQRSRKSSGSIAGSTHSRAQTLPRPNSKFTLPASTNAPNPLTDVLSTRYQGLSLQTQSPPKSSSLFSTTSPISPTFNPANAAAGAGVGTGVAMSPFTSIFSHRYSNTPLNDDESDDDEQEGRQYTVIENDWRGARVVGPEALAVAAAGGGLGVEKKKWAGLRKLGRK
ncbi:hypothetical protein CI109_102894 [Kwoniella shandongensis]|uniref:Uncharacterized protein n=1 Tax=Kwoniella shandongensis TaxID=1734106 RepID=A0A5M6C840_9TREE|nr:uncharacterized protein CI109_000084 [Kwoniella shandongensis]KAA5531244.1 hypothetical protein CI109_000084 [Kwoniella shandongensis]